MSSSETDKPVVFAQEPSERAGTEAVGRILAAAEELFARQGFDAVSMNTIAEAASVSKANPLRSPRRAADGGSSMPGTVIEEDLVAKRKIVINEAPGRLFNAAA